MRFCLEFVNDATCYVEAVDLDDDGKTICLYRYVARRSRSACIDDPERDHCDLQLLLGARTSATGALTSPPAERRVFSVMTRSRHLLRCFDPDPVRELTLDVRLGSSSEPERDPGLGELESD